MTWAGLIEVVEQLLIVVALLSAIWSAYTFITAQKAHGERNRAIEIATWRKLAVQELVANSGPYMSVKDIVKELRSESFNTDLEIRREELSESSVRQLVLELVVEGILGQVHPDQFGIVQLPRDITAGSVAEDIHARYATKYAFREIFKHPKRFTSEELFSELNPTPSMELADFVLSLLSLENHGAAMRGADGKWFPVMNKEQA